MVYYSAIKKNRILPFAATWIKLKSIVIGEISQSEKDKYYMISLACGSKQAEVINRESTMVVTRGWGRGDRMDVV